MSVGGGSEDRPAPLFPRLRLAGLAAVIVGAALVAYWPIFKAGFILDDDVIVTGNPLVKAPGGLYWMWFSARPVDYWPVTSTAAWFEWRLWGMNAAGYHATNVALHAAEALMFWALLRRLRVPGAWFAALLFTVHPVNVESVGWIAQIKNQMGMLFALVTLLCYLRTGYARESEPEGSWRVGGWRETWVRFIGGWSLPWYLVTLAAFTFAMLGKGSVAPLPLVLAGMIAWRRKFRVRDAVRLAPFFLVAAVLTLVNLWFQGHGSNWMQPPAGRLGLAAKVLQAGGVVWFYLGKALWPARLAFVYAPWAVRAADPRWWVPLGAALAATAALWALRGRPWGRAVLFAWGYFCVSLIPVLGFADIGFLRFSPVADHYQHLALLGVAAAVAAGGAVLWKRLGRAGRAVLAAAGAAAVAALARGTWRMSVEYHDQESLYSATLRQNPSCWMADDGLGTYLANQGRLAEALPHLERAARENPDSAAVLFDLGNCYLGLGRPKDAAGLLEAAVHVNPADPIACYNLAGIYTRSGRPDLALLRYRLALKLDPGFAAAWGNYGGALSQTGHQGPAIEAYVQALKLEPGNVDACYGLGLTLVRVGRAAEAVSVLQESVAQTPRRAAAHHLLGVALCGSGRTAEGLEEFRAALRLQPDYPTARADLERFGAGR